MNMIMQHDRVMILYVLHVHPSPLPSTIPVTIPVTIHLRGSASRRKQAPQLSFPNFSRLIVPAAALAVYHTHTLAAVASPDGEQCDQ
jgi:hypothetical protein